jgi:uncharacterized caspase-like protein
MGNLVDGKAGEGSVFFEHATDNDCINSKDILKSLTDFLECLQEQNIKKNKTLVDSLMIYFLGHGVWWNSQDYLIGTNGKPTLLKISQINIRPSESTEWRWAANRAF